MKKPLSDPPGGSINQEQYDTAGVYSPWAYGRRNETKKGPLKVDPP